MSDIDTITRANGLDFDWYWPIYRKYRRHIIDNHADMKYYDDEIHYFEEYISYEKLEHDEIQTITCPWSIHCKCKWQISFKVEYALTFLEVEN